MTRPARIRPIATRVSRTAGSHNGSLQGWRPRQTFSYNQQADERILSQVRAADLVSNDWAASSGINSIGANAVGVGLKPQSRLNAKRLGLKEEDAVQLQNDIESVWKDWTPNAEARGMLHFEDMQLLALRSALRQGELLHLPVKLEDPLRPVKLAIQALQPKRLMTPLDLISNPNIVDGIELGPYGNPQYYWIATPSGNLSHYGYTSLTSSDFSRRPAKIGHRPNVFHLFRHSEEEQLRGESILQPGMNLFRHSADSLDNELLSQVVTASLAMFIATEDNDVTALGLQPGMNESTGKKQYYHEVVGGTVMYGNRNEKPYMLESSRPSPNFAKFYEYVLRAMAASIDMPYEVVAKDFSKTNYSSARAALLEAWRVYMMYRDWLVRHYCHPIWCMVIEEAWLRGDLKFPDYAPDFYDATRLYTQAMWLGPARGHIDPVKEINATVTALENHLMTFSQAIGETGYDFDETIDERIEEEKRLSQLRKTNPTSDNGEMNA